MASGLGAPTEYACPYHYCFVIDGDGIVQYRGGGVNIPALSLVVEEVVSRIENPEVGVADMPPAVVTLAPNVPNPFNPSTRLEFSVARDGVAVRLAVYDLRGQLVRTLLSGTLDSGPHEVTWDGRDATGRTVASGAYVARLVADGHSEQRIMTLAK